jgi:hypothetical protein
VKSHWSSLGLTGPLVLLAVLRPPSAWSQKAPDSGRVASLEARIVTDSAGCPTAVDLWLASTSDTVKGLEALLQWDRPDLVRFAPAAPLNSRKSDSAADSTVLARTAKPANSAAIDTRGGLLAGWEYVEARSSDGLTVKITAFSSLLPRRKATPIPPGKHGRLCRLPLAAVTGGALPAPGDSLCVWLDAVKTRLSNASGDLFGDVKLRRGIISLAPCLAGHRSRR